MRVMSKVAMTDENLFNAYLESPDGQAWQATQLGSGIVQNPNPVIPMQKAFDASSPATRSPNQYQETGTADVYNPDQPIFIFEYKKSILPILIIAGLAYYLIFTKKRS